MAEVLSPSQPTSLSSQPRKAPVLAPPSISTSQPLPVAIPPNSAVRNGHLNLDTFSPVNQNGSFEFDRVLKSGEVYKCTRKTRQWKKCYLVLRPNLLSIYKNASEERLHKQVSLSDLTAVAQIKDPKRRREHVFGLFSPSRNYRLQARDDKDARTWVDLIRHEARIDEEEQEMFLTSPAARESQVFTGQERPSNEEDDQDWERDRLVSSSPEPMDIAVRKSTTRDGIRVPGIRRASTHDLDYSGNEMGSQTDWSDSPAQHYGHASSLTLSQPKMRNITEASIPTVPLQSQPLEPAMARNISQLSGFHIDQDKEWVIKNGYLLWLKSKGGVRQWKKLWVVLRPKNLAFYKNEEEYAVDRIIPLSSIISAVEIDPVSRGKSLCMQIIVEDKTYRFCAPDEEDLARWLGALKSQLAKRKEASSKKAGPVL